jgi:hypothetical protein
LIEATIIVPFYKMLQWTDKNLNRVLSGTKTAMPTVDAYIELHAGP